MAVAGGIVRGRAEPDAAGRYWARPSGAGRCQAVPGGAWRGWVVPGGAMGRLPLPLMIELRGLCVLDWQSDAAPLFPLGSP